MEEADPAGADSLLASCSCGVMEGRERWRDGGHWARDGETGGWRVAAIGRRVLAAMGRRGSWGRVTGLVG